MAKKTNVDEDNYFYINVDEFKTEPDPIVLRKQQKEQINNAEPKSLKLAHRTRRDDFYHNMEACHRAGHPLPDFAGDYFSWLEDYIEELECQVEELQKNPGVKKKKKIIYRVEELLEHDLDTEHRVVYTGTDVKEARKRWMEYFQFFDETGDEHYVFPPEHSDKKYTGLELKQKFLDYFNEHINNNKSIDFCCDCSEFAAEYGQDVGDGMCGCKVEIIIA